MLFATRIETAARPPKDNLEGHGIFRDPEPGYEGGSLLFIYLFESQTICNCIDWGWMEVGELGRSAARVWVGELEEGRVQGGGGVYKLLTPYFEIVL